MPDTEAVQKVFAGTGLCLAVMLFLCSVLVLGLYGAATDFDNSSCDKIPIRERTSGVGLTAGCLGFIFSIISACLWLLPVVKPPLSEGSAFIANKAILAIGGKGEKGDAHNLEPFVVVVVDLCYWRWGY